MTHFGRFAYRLGWLLFRISFASLWRVRVTGLENIPPEGGVLIASNHISLADPPLIGSTMAKPVYYMGKKELFDIPGFGWLLGQLNTFPVSRDSSDLRAFRTAIRIVSSGSILVMFPQGGRKGEDEDESSYEYKDGIGMISCLGRVPVVPCFIRNTNRLARFCRIGIYYGKPVFPPERRDRRSYSELAGEVMLRIRALKEVSRRTQG